MKDEKVAKIPRIHPNGEIGFRKEHALPVIDPHTQSSGDAGPGDGWPDYCSGSENPDDWEEDSNLN